MWVPRFSTRPLARIAVLALSAATAACGGSVATTSVTGPTGTRCEVSVANSTPEVPADGGRGTLTITSARECSWSASAEASWISLGVTSGQGAATLNYSVLPNPNGTPRRGRVVVSEHPVDIAQAAAPCRFEVSPATVAVTSAPGEISIRLSTLEGCKWTSRSDVPWIGSIAPAEGTGSATIRLAVAPNPAQRRTGTVAFGEATVHVEQSGAAGPGPAPAPPPGPAPGTTCSYEISPARRAVGPAGEQVAIDVTTQPGCAWVAASNAPWLAVAGTRTGTGNGSVRVAVSANGGGSRTGTVTIADQTVTIEQAAAAAPSCNYRLAQSTHNVGAEAQELVVGVSAGAECTWSASSDAAWITVADGRSGAGDGNVRLVVAQNSGAPRSGTVRIATETYTVHQAGGQCTYSIKPTYYNAGRGPDQIVINVTAPSGCAWTASADASWVTVEGRSGSGDGIVRLMIPENTGPPRTATIRIAGQTFTLQQDGPCTASIKPGYYNAGRGPDEIRIAVTAEGACRWTAASSVNWVSVAEGQSGSGSGTVRLTVQPNSGAPRSVTLTIAGQPFELRQEGSQ